VELMAHPTDLQECAIEFESAGQARMRVQWKSTVPPDWKGDNSDGRLARLRRGRPMKLNRNATVIVCFLDQSPCP
jgi:hypothetical protein